MALWCKMYAHLACVSCWCQNQGVLSRRKTSQQSPADCAAATSRVFQCDSLTASATMPAPLRWRGGARCRRIQLMCQAGAKIKGCCLGEINSNSRLQMAPPLRAENLGAIVCLPQQASLHGSAGAVVGGVGPSIAYVGLVPKSRVVV